SGPGYATGKSFTAFIDLPARPAAATQLAAAARKNEMREFRCALLTASGTVEHALAVHPLSTQGGVGHLVVAGVTPPPPRPPTPGPGAPPPPPPAGGGGGPAPPADPGAGWS